MAHERPDELVTIDEMWNIVRHREGANEPKEGYRPDFDAYSSLSDFIACELTLFRITMHDLLRTDYYWDMVDDVKTRINLDLELSLKGDEPSISDLVDSFDMVAIQNDVDRDEYNDAREAWEEERQELFEQANHYDDEFETAYFDAHFDYDEDYQDDFDGPDGPGGYEVSD